MPFAGPAAHSLKLFPSTSTPPTLVSAPTDHPCVLIVDESSESREVLRTVLERRGLHILEACGAHEGLALVRAHHPEVVVLDLDSDAADDHAMQQAYDTESRSHSTSLVMLGKVRVPNPESTGQVLPKPYHYGPLVQKIEQLMQIAKAA